MNKAREGEAWKIWAMQRKLFSRVFQRQQRSLRLYQLTLHVYGGRISRRCRSLSRRCVNSDVGKNVMEVRKSVGWVWDYRWSRCRRVYVWILSDVYAAPQCDHVIPYRSSIPADSSLSTAECCVYSLAHICGWLSCKQSDQVLSLFFGDDCRITCCDQMDCHARWHITCDPYDFRCSDIFFCAGRRRE